MKTIISSIILSSSCLFAAPKGTMEKPDFTKGDKIPALAVHDWNLGATGARGWIYSDKMTTTDARQIYITKIAKDSPANNALQVGDVILGVEGKAFNSDPRTAIGRAITAAEATDGKLSLLRWRKGKSTSITLILPKLGSYSATAPYDCPKSEKIIKQGCEFIAKKITANGNHRHPITRSLNALALLASGDAKYLPLVKKEAEWAANFTTNGYKSWAYSYVMIFLSEYTITTGDKSFLPGLRKLTLEVANGQSEVGSWGHRFVGEDGRLSGYGMMNSTGIPLVISMVLAREAGVKDSIVSEAIEKSAKLLRFYVGKGAIPYGDHTPWTETHEDNGKCGMAAVLFSLLGEKEAANYFSRMSLASHGSERDGGHTGNFFNILWSMPSVAQSGATASGAWMKEFGGWYYDLARQSDGSFIHQGQPQMRNDSYQGWDCTGAYLLSYTMPLKHIYLAKKTGNITTELNAKQAEYIINDGRGWTNKNRNRFDNLSKVELFTKLSSWSPIVRERAAIALKRKNISKDQILEPLTKMLASNHVESQVGACQALAMLKYPESVPALTKCLDSHYLWIRVEAAEALAAIGKPAMSTLPTLLEMVSNGPSKNDPRAMEQRYLSAPIFGSMLKNSLEGVDRKLLQKAIIESLKNQDGRARGSIGKIYQKLSYEEIKPLLPAILAAVKDPAPSGIMFSAEIRLSGLEVLAKHRVKEGMSLCLEVMDLDKWGKKTRIKRCLNALEKYGASAEPLLPQLHQLKARFSNKKEVKSLGGYLGQLKKIISNIEAGKKEANNTPLRSVR